MTTRNAQLNLTGNVDPLIASVNGVTAAIQALAADSSRSFTQVVGGLQSLSTATTAAGSAARKSGDDFGSFVKQALAFATGTSISGLARQFVGDVIGMGEGALQSAGDFEQAQIAFGVFLGGAEKATDFLTRLQQFANVSPFRFEPLQQASRELLAMGVNGDQVLPLLKDIATAVSAVGGSDASLQRVTAALAKMGAEGKTSAVFLNELTRDGIPAWSMLAEATGKTIPQLRELSAAGEITADTFQRAFSTYVVEHYSDALEKQSHTWNGLVSTAQDLEGQFSRTFGAGLVEALEPRLQALVTTLSDPKVITTIQSWGVAVGQFAGQLWDAATAVAGLFGLSLPAVTARTQEAATAATGLGTTWAGISTAVDDSKDRIAVLQDTQTKIRDDATATGRAYDTQIARLRDQVTLLDRAYDATRKTHDLNRLEADLAQDRTLAVNIFTDTGRAAGIRADSEAQQLADKQAEIAHTKEKDAITDTITGLERKKKAAADQATDDERIVAGKIRNIEREKQAAKKAADEQQAWITGLTAADAHRATEMEARWGVTTQTMATTAASTHGLIFDNLLGTPAQQQKLGGDLMANIWTGITAEGQTWFAGWEGFGTSAGAAFRTGFVDKVDWHTVLQEILTGAGQGAVKVQDATRGVLTGPGGLTDQAEYAASSFRFTSPYGPATKVVPPAAGLPLNGLPPNLRGAATGDFSPGGYYGPAPTPAGGAVHHDITIGFDKSTSALAVVRHIIRNSPDDIDQGLAAGYP